MRLTKLLRGLDGFADDKWVSSQAGRCGGSGQPLACFPVARSEAAVIGAVGARLPSHSRSGGRRFGQAALAGQQAGVSSAPGSMSVRKVCPRASSPCESQLRTRVGGHLANVDV